MPQKVGINTEFAWAHHHALTGRACKTKCQDAAICLFIANPLTLGWYSSSQRCRVPLGWWRHRHIHWAQVYNCPPLPHLRLCKKRGKLRRRFANNIWERRTRFCTDCKGDGVIWTHTLTLFFDDGGHIISKLTYNMEGSSRTPGWKSVFLFLLKSGSHATQAGLKLGRWPRTPDLPVFL